MEKIQKDIENNYNARVKADKDLPKLFKLGEGVDFSDSATEEA